MGKSRQIIETLLADVKTYIDNSKIVYEGFKELPDDLESRTITTYGRIALYSEEENVDVKVGAEKPADTRQRYGIDISVPRGYKNLGADNGELIALDMKDLVIEWVKQLDAFTVSSGDLHSFGYERSAGFVRRNKYITLTMMFSGFRDLQTTQST